MMGLGRGVVLEALDRQIYPFRAEQEELLPCQVEGTLVDLLEQVGRTEADPSAGLLDFDLCTLAS